MIYSIKVLETLWRGSPVQDDVVVIYHPKDGFFPTSYTKVVNGKRLRRSTPLFNCWSNMVQRCLTGSQQQMKIKSYVGCVNYFKNYQSFAEFCHALPFFTQKDADGKVYEIDKDIQGFLCKQGGMYSQATLCMIPKDINCFLTCVQRHGETLTRSTKGVIQQSGKNFHVRTQDVCGDKERKVMFRCSSYEEAYEKLCNLKKEQAVFLANKYKGKVEDCVIEFLHSFDLNEWEKWTYEKWESKQNAS